MSYRRYLTSVSIAAALVATTAQADQVFLDDLIVDGSACIGIDCVNGESFGFDTLRLKENNLRIKFQDTSTSASFPSNDWQLTANESANGGANKFSIDDITGNRIPFVVEAGARNNSVYIDTSNVGFGTSTPAVALHARNGNSPALRLEQDGSSGFAPQSFDLAGNEANFFIRDVTNSSTLPFRIKPGAPTDALFVAADGSIGLGTDSPGNELHISDSGNVGIRMDSTDTDSNLRLSLSDGTGAGGLDEFRVVFIGAGGPALAIEADGDATLSGTLTTGGPTCSGGCDRVFAPDYELLSLEQHATLMWENSFLPNVGPTVPHAPMNVGEKMAGILNELEHAHIYIEQLHTRLEVLEEQIAAQ